MVFDNSSVGLAFAKDPQCQVVIHNTAMTMMVGPPWKGSQAARIAFHEAGRYLLSIFRSTERRRPARSSVQWNFILILTPPTTPWC